MNRLDTGTAVPSPETDLLEGIYHSMPTPLLVCDPAGIVREANPAALELISCERKDLLGRPLRTLLSEESGFDPASLSGPTARHDVHRSEEALHTVNGQVLPALLCIRTVTDAEGGVRALICSLTDLRTRSKITAEPSHALQLISVGKLAAGIAHEINTPVQFIGDSVSFLQEAFSDLERLLGDYSRLRDAGGQGSIEPGLIRQVMQTEEDIDLEFLSEEIPKSIKRTLDGVSRVAEITRAIKEFSYPDQKDKVAADLNAVLLTTLALAKNHTKYIADLETDLGDLPPVLCHAGLLSQVFLNLIINAADAIASTRGSDGGLGQIRIRTRHEGDTVLISISDDGPGIPERIRERIFDPFFTTKELGHGTGQGLSIARTVVVEKHHGTLDLETEEGQGTTFHIHLPVDGQTSIEPRGRS